MRALFRNLVDVLKDTVVLIGMIPDYVIAWCDKTIEDLKGHGINYKGSDDQ